MGDVSQTCAIADGTIFLRSGTCVSWYHPNSDQGPKFIFDMWSAFEWEYEGEWSNQSPKMSDSDEAENADD